MNAIWPILAVNIIGAILAFSGMIYWRKKSKSRMILSIYLFALCSLFLIMYVVGQNAQSEHVLINLLSLVFFIVCLIIPPCMYLYLKVLTSDQKPGLLFWKELHHFFPALALLIINGFSFILLYRLDETHEFYDWIVNVMSYANFIALFFVFLVQNFLYLFLSLKIIRQHKNRIKQYFSYAEGINFAWSTTFLLGYFLLILFVYVFQSGLADINPFLLAAILGLYLGIIFFKGNRQADFYQILQINDPELSILESSKPQEKKEILSENKKQLLKEKLVYLIDKEKPYLNDQLTLFQLSKMLDSNTKYLRYLLQDEFDTNFISFINTHRVKEAEILLKSPANNIYTIESIGKMAGFKSKSAFYNSFKKITDETPFKYRKHEK